MAETPGLEIQTLITNVKGASKVKLKGYLDAETIALLSEKVLDLLHRKFGKIAFDLAEVTFISSSGWGTLVNLAKETQKNKGAIVLYNMSPKVERIYNLLDLSPILPVFMNESDALGHLEK